jgi:hypothetical protein
LPGPQAVGEKGLGAVLGRKQTRATPAVPPILDGEKEAKLIALAYSKPPKGRVRWPLRLLKVVELKIVDRAGDSTIGRLLKNPIKPHRREQWVIPPKANSAFLAAMEDVLAVYTRPRDPDRPLVCSRRPQNSHRRDAHADPDETGPARCERSGTANLFMMFAPLEGWPHVKVTDPHTAVEYAHILKDQRPRRYPLRQGQGHRPGSGQRQHPQQGFTLRSAPSPRSPPAGQALRMALHAKARQLAQSLRAAFFPPNASTATSPTTKSSLTRLPPGIKIEMQSTP